MREPIFAVHRNVRASLSTALHQSLPWIIIAIFLVAQLLIMFRGSLIYGLKFLHTAYETAGGFDQQNRFLLLKIWVVFMLIQAVLWGTVSYVSFLWIFEFWITGDPRGRAVRVIRVFCRICVFASPMILLLHRNPAWQLGMYSSEVNFTGAGVIAFVAAGAIASCMWVAESRVLWLTQGRGLSDPLSTVQRYFVLRQKVQLLLFLLSLVLVMGIVGVLIRRMCAQSFNGNHAYPAEAVVLEGLVYTFLIALAYVPVHTTFNTIGTRIREAAVSYPRPSSIVGIETWSKQLTELDDILKLRIEEWKTIGPGFPILAPFLISLLSGLINKH